MADTKAAKAVKETGAERFVRLANARGNKVLNAIDVLGNLAAPSYQYTPEQVTDLMGALSDALRECEAKFAQPTKAERVERTLVK